MQRFTSIIEATEKLKQLSSNSQGTTKLQSLIRCHGIVI